jgi:wobble nucleotide-excising tRNase
MLLCPFALKLYFSPTEFAQCPFVDYSHSEEGGLKVLKRIKLIQGVGSFSQTRPSGIALKPVTVIFGENRYGKSTLCDVLHSLETNNPELIQNRKTIPDNPLVPQKVEIQFESDQEGNHVALFENDQWVTGVPDYSDLYVFDHSFIHRNVLTGTKPERRNAENITNFILGEEDNDRAREVGELNRQIRDERANLRNIEGRLTAKGILNAEAYSVSILPPKTHAELIRDVETYNESANQLSRTIQNAEAIKARAIFGPVGTQVTYKPIFDQINTVLGEQIQHVHESSQTLIDSHIQNHVKDGQFGFKGWAGQGAGFINQEACPFCGQGLGTDAKSLIASYQQVFNTQFDEFNQRVKQSVGGLRNPFVVTAIEMLEQQHQSNKLVLETYPEPEIVGNQEVIRLAGLLVERYQKIVEAHDNLAQWIRYIAGVLPPLLDQKYQVPYQPLATVDFSGIDASATAFNQCIYEYYETMQQLNVILNGFKASVDSQEHSNRVLELRGSSQQATASAFRLELEPICAEYRAKKAEIQALEVRHDQERTDLEQSQSDYLDKYFETINALFESLGNNDFKIIKITNRRGAERVIYELKVQFKGQDIAPDKLHSVFSESDKRALALCVFLAKILLLPGRDKAKAVVIMDDPVTSFDNERITLILMKLDEIQRTIKQLIITTHYKGMAAKTIKKFRRIAGEVQGVHIVREMDGCAFKEKTTDEMMATEHDIAFDRIKAFVNCETNENILTELRPFFEGEIRYRYKQQLAELGHAKSDLSVCTAALRDAGIMSVPLEAKISVLRDSLNTPMHELGGDPLENTRAMATEMLTIVYDDLIAQR